MNADLQGSVGFLTEHIFIFYCHLFNKRIQDSLEHIWPCELLTNVILIYKLFCVSYLKDEMSRSRISLTFTMNIAFVFWNWKAKLPKIGYFNPAFLSD